MRQIYYYRLGSAAARMGCYAVKAGLKLRAAVALPPIFTAEEKDAAPQTEAVHGTVIEQETTPAEEPTVSEKQSEPKPTSTSASPQTNATPQAGDLVYVPGFGYLECQGPGEVTRSEAMYENGNKVGTMG